MKFHVGILIQNSHVRSHQRELYFHMKSEMRKWMRINNSRWWELGLKDGNSLRFYETFLNKRGYDTLNRLM